MTQVEIENWLRERKSELKIWREKAIAETLAKRDKLIEESILPLESSIQKMAELIREKKAEIEKMGITLHFLWVAEHKGTISEEMMKDYEKLSLEHTEKKQAIRLCINDLSLMKAQASSLRKQIKHDTDAKLSRINESYEIEYCNAKERFCRALKKLWEGEKDGD